MEKVVRFTTRRDGSFKYRDKEYLITQDNTLWEYHKRNERYERLGPIWEIINNLNVEKVVNKARDVGLEIPLFRQTYEQKWDNYELITVKAVNDENTDYHISDDLKVIMFTGELFEIPEEVFQEFQEKKEKLREKLKKEYKERKKKYKEEREENKKNIEEKGEFVFRDEDLYLLYEDKEILVSSRLLSDFHNLKG